VRGDGLPTAGLDAADDVERREAGIFFAMFFVY
jgi:hypothetical protein